MEDLRADVLVNRSGCSFELAMEVLPPICTIMNIVRPFEMGVRFGTNKVCVMLLKREMSEQPEYNLK